MPMWWYRRKIYYRISAYRLRLRMLVTRIRKKARVLVRKPFKGTYAYEWQVGTYIFQWKHDDSLVYRQGTHVWKFRVMTDWHWRNG
jgi:hypothetical protein